MAQKKGKPVGAPAPAAAEPDADEEEELDQLPWEQDLALWEQEEKQESESTKFILYRRPDGKNYKEKVWEWQDENPGSHAIGMEFGGGRFSIYGILPGTNKHGKPRIRVRHFVLAQSYTEKKRRRDIEEGFSPQFSTMHPGARPEQKDGLAQLGDIMERIVFPMMAMMQKIQPPAAAASPMDSMRGLSEMMHGMIQENARSTIRLVNEVTKEAAMNRREQAAEVGSGGDEEEASEFDIKEFLKDAIKEYGPLLLNATGLKLKAATKFIQNDDVFQALSANKSLFDRVLFLLTQDPEVDQDTTKKVLDKLAKLGVGAFVPTKPAAPAPRPPTNGHAAAHPAAAVEESHVP